MNRSCRFSTLFLLTCAIVSGQASASTFDVAVVKEHSAHGDGSSESFLPSGQIALTNRSLGTLIREAWKVNEKDFDGPSWLESTYYDVIAKGPALKPADESRQMLRALLIERFSIKYHFDDAAITSLNLEVGKRGAKLETSKVDVHGDCVASARGQLRRRTCKGLTMEDLAHLLTVVGAQGSWVVVDNTHISGRFDFSIEWGHLSAPQDIDDGGNDVLQQMVRPLGLVLKKGPTQHRSRLIIETVSRAIHSDER